LLEWNRRLGAGLLTSAAGLKLKVLKLLLRVVLVHQLVEEVVGHVRSLRRARDLGWRRLEDVGRGHGFYSTVTYQEARVIPVCDPGMLSAS
jgi:hypothetical protein